MLEEARDVSAWELQGQPHWDDHRVVRPCDGLTMSRPPLSQQLLLKLREGDLTLAWQGGSPCHL